MELEKRYRTYGVALGIDLGNEKRYRTFRYNSGEEQNSHQNSWDF